jgi:hypothetical protein
MGKRISIQNVLRTQIIKTKIANNPISRWVNELNRHEVFQMNKNEWQTNG